MHYLSSVFSDIGILPLLASQAVAHGIALSGAEKNLRLGGKDRF